MTVKVIVTEGTENLEAELQQFMSTILNIEIVAMSQCPCGNGTIVTTIVYCRK